MSLGFLTRHLPRPDRWTAADDVLHAACEFADESTMPPYPGKMDLEALERWANDLCATHETGDMGRMLVGVLRQGITVLRVGSEDPDLGKHDD